LSISSRQSDAKELCPSAAVAEDRKVLFENLMSPAPISHGRESGESSEKNLDDLEYCTPGKIFLSPNALEKIVSLEPCTPEKVLSLARVPFEPVRVFLPVNETRLFTGQVQEFWMRKFPYLGSFISRPKLVEVPFDFRCKNYV